MTNCDSPQRPGALCPGCRASLAWIEDQLRDIRNLLARLASETIDRKDGNHDRSDCAGACPLFGMPPGGPRVVP